MFRNISSSKLWLDQRPPESLREIYNSCLLRLKEIKTNLDELDFKYSIDEANRFKTFSNLSLRLNRIRQLAGIANLKNQKSILEVIKIVNYNIKKNNEEQLRTIQKETLNRQISIESDNESTQSDSKDSDDDYSDDEHLKQDLKTFFNFSNKISKVIREKQEEARINEFLNIDKKKYDNLISPLLNSIKRNFIQIDQESLVDLDCLINIQDLTLQAINTEYSQIIELIEQINSLCDKYLLSFYEKTIEDLSILDKEPQLEHSKKLLKNFEQILKYDQKKNSIFKTIKKNLHNLKNLYLLFSEENSNGILSKNLSDFSKNLSKRFDLDDVQVVLLIPEFSYLLNDCVILLREWINYDSQYSGLIENDMKIFDRKKRDLLDDKIFFDRIYKKLYRRIDLLRTELIETSQKFKAVLTLDVEIEEKRISSVDMRLYFDKIELNLNEIESEMNKLNRMGLVEAKKRSLLKQKLDYFEKDMNLFYIENKVKQIDVEILETSYFKLKNVLIYKSLNETVEKIYYNQGPPKYVST
ncbi:unnamed protein product [Brachionus calyciflorus]|uniref:Uncharacterized protein n=1 Tax=Brachionus calyciflorus TaxID=104777 RepID=A0A814QUK6_9BILA|nr:unnamed protein product [Brachionus calyciflorus]